jgi:hypothetical protein
MDIVKFLKEYKTNKNKDLNEVKEITKSPYQCDSL